MAFIKIMRMAYEMKSPATDLFYMMQTKERLPSLDVIRVLACLMVVFVHSPMKAELTTATDTYLLGPLTYLMSPCNGLFFMISGALLLKPRDVKYNQFLKHRMPKVAIPVIVWSVIYMAIVCLTKIPQGERISYLGHNIVTILFSSSEDVNGTLWFMYALIGIYLLVPIITPWWQRASKREIEFYLVIWLIAMCLPYLQMFFGIADDETSLLYYFSGYLGYFVLGAYLRRFDIAHSKMRNVIFICAAIGALALPAAVILTTGNTGNGILWSLSISSASMATVWFVLIMRSRFCNAPNRLTIFVAWLSPLTFGIYLMHVLFMKTIKGSGMFADAQYIISIPAISIMTFALAAFFSWLIHKLPFSKYIIGD